jgi:hypothetical protein
MNLRRGLSRLWIVGSALFVLAVAFVGYTEIKEQFTAVASMSKAEWPVHLQGSGSDIPNTIRTLGQLLGHGQALHWAFR